MGILNTFWKVIEMKEHISNCFPYHFQFPRNVQALSILIKNILPSVIYIYTYEGCHLIPRSSQLEVFGDFWQIFQCWDTVFILLTLKKKFLLYLASKYMVQIVCPNSNSSPRPLLRLLSSCIAYSPPQHQLKMPPFMSFMESLQNWGVMKAGFAEEEAPTISKVRDHKGLPAVASIRSWYPFPLFRIHLAPHLP